MGYSRRIMMFLHIFVDYLAVILAEHTAFWLQGMFRAEAGSQMVLPWDYQYIYIPGMFLLIMLHSDCYRFNRPSLDVARDVFRGACFSFLMYIMVIFLMRNSMQVSRYYAGCFLVFMLLYIAVGRYILGKILLGASYLKEPVLLLGAGRTAERLLSAIESDPCYCYRVAGILDDHPKSRLLPEKYPLLGGFQDAADVIKRQKIRTLIITAPGLKKEQLQKLISQVQPYVRNISFVPDLLGTQVMGVEANVFFTEKILVLKIKNQLARRRNRVIKRVFDLLLSAVILLPALVVMLGVSIAIRCESDGPVLFNAMRIGREGKEFLCYKFRSMYINADEILEKYLSDNAEARAEWNEFQKLKGYDPRVTRVGRIIRRTSLDELPQIVNVILGTMSFVGPRPYLPREKEKMGSYFDTICRTTPGITGLWQVSGRNDVTFNGRLHFDEWYVRNWSIWIDLMCLFKTVKIVLFGRGAY